MSGFEKIPHRAFVGHARLLLVVALVSGLACRVSDAESLASDPAGDPVERLERSTHEASWHDGVVVYDNVGATTSERALVLVHGWASTTAAWKNQLPELGRLGRVLAINLPGHGGSTVPPGGVYSLDVFADAIATVLDDAGVRSAVMVGHSNGTPVSLRFARRHPERTLGLVAVDGSLLPMGTPQQIEQMLGPLKLDTYREWVAGMIDGMGGESLSQEDVEGLKAMADEIDQATLLDSVVATADPEMWSDEPLELPALAILAEQPTWSDTYRAEVEAILPNIEWVIWSDVSHFLMMERPAEFQQALGDWLEQNQLP